MSLQTSVAKHLAQRQLSKCASDVNIKHENVKVKNSGDPSLSGTSILGAELRSHSIEGDRTSKINGPKVSQDLLPNGSLEMARSGAVSLLNTIGSSSAINGDADLSELVKTRPETLVIKTLGSSTDNTYPNIMKVTWPSGAFHKHTGSGINTMPTTITTPQGKNIVISAINKVNSNAVTKVLAPSNQGATSRSSPSNVPSQSILSPRVSGSQSNIRMVGGTMTRQTSSGSTNAKVSLITVGGPQGKCKPREAYCYKLLWQKRLS